MSCSGRFSPQSSIDHLFPALSGSALNYSPSHNRLTHPQTVHCRWFICTFPIYGHNSSTSKNNKSTSKEQQQQDKLITLNYRRSSTNKSKRVTTDGGGGISFESMICSADGKTNNLLREVINWRLPSSSAAIRIYGPCRFCDEWSPVNTNIGNRVPISLTWLGLFVSRRSPTLIDR